MHKKIFCLLFLSTFVFNDVFRIAFGEGSAIHLFNILLLTSGLLYFGWGIKHRRVRPIILYLLFSFSLLMLIQIPLNHSISKVVTLIMLLSTYIVPLLILSVKLKNDEANDFLRVFLKLFNPLCIILVIIGLIDFATNASVQLFLADKFFYGTTVYNYIYGEHIWGVYRYYSIIGLPLTMTKYFLLFYSLNHIYAKKHKFLIPSSLVMIVSLIGILLSGSKTGIILFLFLVVFASHSKRFKLGFYVIAAIAIWVFTLTPIYQEVVKERFSQGIQSGDLSTGRNQLFEAFLSSDTEKPGFFVGEGINHSREVVANLRVSNIFNFEYPFLMIPYDYGILCTVIMYSLLFIFPIFILLFRKDFFVLTHFLVVLIMVNNNNGLATIATDYTSQFVLVLVILVNLGHVGKRRLKNNSQPTNVAA